MFRDYSPLCYAERGQKAKLFGGELVYNYAASSIVIENRIF
jgi:hypothetical protein